MPYVSRTIPAESDEEYPVERILDCRGRGRSTEYLIKWVGYPEPTWTWHFNCSCPERLADFRRRRRVERRRRRARSDEIASGGEHPARSLSFDSSGSSSGNSSDGFAPPEVLSSEMPCNRTSEGEPVCIVCLEHRITHIVQPCNHACLCAQCSVPVASLRGCPKCRGSMTRIAPFYVG